MRGALTKIKVRSLGSLITPANKRPPSTRFTLTQPISRLVTTDAGTQPSRSSQSQWPLTVAVSLLAFVVGLGVETERRRSLGTSNVTREEWKQSLQDLEETLVGSFKSGGESDENKTHKTEHGNDNHSEAAQDDSDSKNDDDDDVPTLPDIDPSDSKGWREFAEAVLEKLTKKRDALKDAQQELNTAQGTYDDLNHTNQANRIDSQRNAELALEYLVGNQQNDKLLIDDDLIRAHPWEPVADLFDPETKLTVLRVLDDKDLTSCLVINLSGPVPSEDPDKNQEQWDYLLSWVDEVVRDLQQAGQIRTGDFWNFIWSRGWYKCGYPSYRIPGRSPNLIDDQMEAARVHARLTSGEGMERYRLPTVAPERGYVKPIKGRLGMCSAEATLFPGTVDDDGKPRRCQVLVDTGAEVTTVDRRYLPPDACILTVPSFTVNGFGGGSSVLDERVQLRMKLLDDDGDNGIEIQATAYVLDKTASGLGVELGTDVMKPLGLVVDIDKGLLRAGTGKANVVYLKSEDQMNPPGAEAENEKENKGTEESKKDGKEKRSDDISTIGLVYE